jgi:hypothetical protein
MPRVGARRQAGQVCQRIHLRGGYLGRFKTLLLGLMASILVLQLRFDGGPSAAMRLARRLLELVSR